MKSNVGDGEVAAAVASNKSVPMKKELFCKYCNKKFTSYQALGGHQNAHKGERSAEKENKILSMASACCYRNSRVGGFVNSNHVYGFGGKTLGVSSLSMTRFKPRYSWHQMGIGLHDYHHVLWEGNQILNPFQPTIQQLNTLTAEWSASHQHHKSYQHLISSTVRGRPTNHITNPKLLCDQENFGQASNSLIVPQNAIKERPDLNVKPVCDLENFGQENNSSSISMPVNGAFKKLDLTLKL